MAKSDRGTIIFKTVYYLLTLLGLGLLAWALYSLHTHSDIAIVLWIFIYILLAVYFAMAVVSIRKRGGFNRFVVHVLTLQIIPICVAITIFSILPDEEAAKSMPVTELEVVSEDDVDSKDKSDTEDNAASEPAEPKPHTPLTGRPRDYERAFNDLQDKQKAAAEKNGLATFQSRADVEAKYAQLQREGKLVKISTNPKYIVRELTHSSPYVVPKMAKLLNDIAISFQEKTQSKAQFVITSVLRTEEDIKKLKKKNGNASSNSCHCNATTVDISYSRFGQEGEGEQEDYHLRLALAKTLHELRAEGRCYVKIERKQYCYHITVR